jgi:protein-tyrosine phosphatase
MRSAPARRVRFLGRLVLSRSARADAWHELRRRVRGEPLLPEGPLDHLLVLCHGNICRSPFAAALLAARLPTREVRSGGLHAGDANPADATAARCADRLGVSLAAHRSRRVDADLLAWADLVLVMEGSHAAAIRRDWPRFASRVRLLGDYLPDPPHLLSDPWGAPEPVFDRVFHRIVTAVDNLAKRLDSRR